MGNEEVASAKKAATSTERSATTKATVDATLEDTSASREDQEVRQRS